MEPWCAPDASSHSPKELGIDGCPRSTWEEKVAAAVPREPPVHYVNVGANKGYNAVGFLNLWTEARIKKMWWHALIMEYAVEQNLTRSLHVKHPLALQSTVACGACKACRDGMPAEHERRGGVASLLDLNPRNSALLR